jgi:hypothetical protein
LKIISPNLEIAIEKSTPSPIDKKSLLKAVSQNVYDSVRDENEIYFEGFIVGLQDTARRNQS